MNHNPFIWVLLESGETQAVFANLTDEVITNLAVMFFDVMEDPDDQYAPRTSADVEQMIRKDVLESEDHTGSYNIYELRRWELNTLSSGEILINTPDLEIKSGSEIYEASIRIVMGCDMSYALEPVGFFTSKLPDSTLTGIEWHKRTLS